MQPDTKHHTPCKMTWTRMEWSSFFYFTSTLELYNLEENGKRKGFSSSLSTQQNDFIDLNQTNDSNNSKRKSLIFNELSGSKLTGKKKT